MLREMTSWNGRNALTGVIHLFNNIDAVRSNIRPEARIHGVITEGGAAPNVVPDRAVADFYIRYPDAVYLRQVTEFGETRVRDDEGALRRVPAGAGEDVRRAEGPGGEVGEKA
jgi:metal-dependent amidase/aminoacylase/carboxypeptidase family protein